MSSIEGLIKECYVDCIGIYMVDKPPDWKWNGEFDAEYRVFAMAQIRQLLEHPDIVAGSLSNRGVFTPWNLSIDETIEQILSEWEARNWGDPGIFEIVAISVWPIPKGHFFYRDSDE